MLSVAYYTPSFPDLGLGMQNASYQGDTRCLGTLNDAIRKCSRPDFQPRDHPLCGLGNSSVPCVPTTVGVVIVTCGSSTTWRVVCPTSTTLATFWEHTNGASCGAGSAPRRSQARFSRWAVGSERLRASSVVVGIASWRWISQMRKP